MARPRRPVGLTLWLDAQLSPHLAPWITDNLSVECRAVRDLGLRDARDREIFRAARDADVVVITKDIDFVYLLHQLGPPPRILWISSGNTSNAVLRDTLRRSMPRALPAQVESLVVMDDAQRRG